VLGCKTDGNVTAMTTVSLNKFKLSTYIVGQVKARAFLAYC